MAMEARTRLRSRCVIGEGEGIHPFSDVSSTSPMFSAKLQNKMLDTSEQSAYFVLVLPNRGFS